MKAFDEPLKMLSLILQLGIIMLVSIIGPTLVFAWLGTRIGVRWLAVAGFFLGAIGGMQGCFRLIKRMTADWPRDEVWQGSIDGASDEDHRT